MFTYGSFQCQVAFSSNSHEAFESVPISTILCSRHSQQIFYYILTLLHAGLLELPKWALKKDPHVAESVHSLRVLTTEYLSYLQYLESHGFLF